MILAKFGRPNQATMAVISLRNSLHFTERQNSEPTNGNGCTTTWRSNSMPPCGYWWTVFTFWSTHEIQCLLRWNPESL